MSIVYYGNFSITKMNVLNKTKFHIKRMSERLKPCSFIFSYSLISKNADGNFAAEISFDSFIAQLKYIKDRYNIISLDTLTEALRSNKLHRNSMALTFDIGYLETLELVVPFLKSMQIPAAFFIRNEDIAADTNIPIDDILREIFLGKISPKLQEDLENYLKNEGYHWTLNSRVEKIEAFHRILRLIYKLEKSKRIDMIDNMLKSCPLNLENKNKYGVAGREHLREVEKNNLFSMGINFNFFSGLESEDQFNEILERKRSFEAEINNEIKYCSYFLLDPENYWIDVAGIFKSMGFKAACFDMPSLIKNDTNIYQIPRLNPRNVGLQQFKINLNEFLKY